MKRNALLALAVGVFALAFAGSIKAQDAKIDGKWTATIHAPDKTMTETWTLKQAGADITGTDKNDKGELPVAGKVSGTTFHGLVTDGDQHYQVNLTIDGNDADGTIRMGKNEFLIMMKKSN